MFPAMLATIVDPGYKIALFLHILAVVLAFGPTFGYAFFFSVTPQFPRATPAILAGIQKIDRYLVQPGTDRAAAGWDLPPGRWSLGCGRRLCQHRLPRHHRPLWPFTRLLPAADRSVPASLAERDLKKGDELGPEFTAIAERLSKVGSLAGLIVVVTVFFMTYKPFL